MTDWASAKAAADAAVLVAGPTLAAPYLVHIDVLAKIGPVYNDALTPAVSAARSAWLTRFDAALSARLAERRTAVEAADRAARRAERLELDARAGIPSAALVRNGSTFVLAPDVAVPTGSIDAAVRTATRSLSAGGTPMLRVAAKREGAIGNNITVGVTHGAGTTFTLTVGYGAAFTEPLLFSAPGALVASELVSFEWLGATRPDASAAVPLENGAGDVFDVVRERLQRAVNFDAARSIRPVLAAALAALDVLAVPPNTASIPTDNSTYALVAAYDTKPVALLYTNADGSIQSIAAFTGSAPTRGATVLSVRAMEDRLRAAITALEPLVSAMTGAL
ncbi:MAG: hypothetical protein JNK05_17855 [Myxococcales bacterium]|nr:hypothetical protein [Myxococcales bacterium]